MGETKDERKIIKEEGGRERSLRKGKLGEDEKNKKKGVRGFSPLRHFPSLSSFLPLCLLVLLLPSTPLPAGWLLNLPSFQSSPFLFHSPTSLLTSPSQSLPSLSHHSPTAFTSSDPSPSATASCHPPRGRHTDGRVTLVSLSPHDALPQCLRY